MLSINQMRMTSKEDMLLLEEGLKVTRETMEVENGMAVGAGRPPLCTRVE
jgi:hypothetical protein